MMLTGRTAQRSRCSAAVAECSTSSAIDRPNSRDSSLSSFYHSSCFERKKCHYTAIYMYLSVGAWHFRNRLSEKPNLTTPRWAANIRHAAPNANIHHCVAARPCVGTQAQCGALASISADSARVFTDGRDCRQQRGHIWLCGRVSSPSWHGTTATTTASSVTATAGGDQELLSSQKSSVGLPSLHIASGAPTLTQMLPQKRICQRCPACI